MKKPSVRITRETEQFRQLVGKDKDVNVDLINKEIRAWISPKLVRDLKMREEEAMVEGGSR